MTNKQDAAHVKTLDELERSKAAGTITTSEYDVRRAKILSEVSERPMNVGVAILVIVGVLIVLIVVARLVVGFTSGQ